jgi:putative membrane protein
VRIGIVRGEHGRRRGAVRGIGGKGSGASKKARGEPECREQVNCGAMLWLKAFHVVFVVTWFAGLFYLPRLFVYHASATDAIGRERFQVMERRLFVIMSIGAVLTIALGAAMLWREPTYLELGWMHIKLTLVALLVVYHLWCHRLMRKLRSGATAHSPTWYRWFNELPGVFLIAIVILAVVKPVF